ncbi:MAG: hypothetical protein AAFQ20_16995 [Bacteroidota bacterium]
MKRIKTITLMTVLFSIGITMAQTKRDNDNTKMGMQNIKTPVWHQNQNEASIALSINGKKQMQLKLEERSLEALKQAFEEKRYTIMLKNPKDSGLKEGNHPFVFRTRIFVNGTQMEEIEEEEEINMFPGDIFIPITHFACFPPVGNIIADTAAEDELKIELSIQSLKNEQQVDALVFFL